MDRFQKTDLKKLLDAVIEMRAAQKLEWDALPSNYARWKRARKQGHVARLEAKVDALLDEALRADDKDAPEQ
jgi:hypothetical protein